MVPKFNYFQESNVFKLGYVFRTERDKGVLKPFKESLVGYEWDYTKDHSKYFLQ